MLVLSLEKVRRLCFPAAVKYSHMPLPSIQMSPLYGQGQVLSNYFSNWMCCFPKLLLPTKTSAVFLFTVPQMLCFPVSKAIIIMQDVCMLHIKYCFVLFVSTKFIVKQISNFLTVVINFMSQLEWAKGYPDR